MPPSHGLRSARTTPGPSGIKLDDGYQTLIAFALAPTIAFWEKTVKPPGLDGGDKIDTSTMHNVDWRTFAPRALTTMTDMQTKVAYDPVIYSTIVDTLLNRETTITVHFPDTSRVSFYGFLRSFEIDDHVEGQQPEATVVITPTNQDPTTGAESGPAVDSVPGT